MTVQVATAVKESINQATDAAACDNFYEYACGGQPPYPLSTASPEYSPLFNLVLDDLYKMAAGGCKILKEKKKNKKC